MPVVLLHLILAVTMQVCFDTPAQFGTNTFQIRIIQKCTMFNTQLSHSGLQSSGFQTRGFLRVLNRGHRVDGGHNVQPNFVMAAQVFKLVCCLALY
jgi:hypothetical protein